MLHNLKTCNDYWEFWTYCNNHIAVAMCLTINALCESSPVPLCSFEFNTNSFCYSTSSRIDLKCWKMNSHYVWHFPIFTMYLTDKVGKLQWNCCKAKWTYFVKKQAKSKEISDFPSVFYLNTMKLVGWDQTLRTFFP